MPDLTKNVKNTENKAAVKPFNNILLTNKKYGGFKNEQRYYETEIYRKRA